MDAAELARWTRFAAKGGIGKCTAVQDCVAEREQDLMFLTNDDITVLMQLPDREGVYLGYCEGVVGHFQASDVQFRSKLKKPVMTKRSSTVSAKSPPSASPSPIPASTPLPRPISHSSTSAISGSTRKHAATVQVSPSAQQPEFPFSEGGTSTPGILSHYCTYSSPQPMMPDEYEISPSDGGLQTTTTSVSVLDISRYISASPVGESRDLDPLDELFADSEENSLPENDVIALQPASFGQEPAPLGRRLSEPHRPFQEPTLDYSAPNSRISAAMSDGEVGIGNSLLQDVENGDAWSSTYSSDSFSSVPNDETWVSSEPLNDNPVTPVAQPNLPSGRTTSHSGSSGREVSSPELKARSHSGPGEEYWEGASDIYDDYRYSRQSITSKVSRYSQNSIHSAHTTHSVPKVPPVPNDSRPSGEGRRSNESQSSVYTRSSRISKTGAVPQPAPLDLISEKGRAAPIDSPLHEDLSMPHMFFDRPTSFISPALTPSSPAWAGVATALRQRLEKSHRSQDSQGSFNRREESSRNDPVDNANCSIVIEDDEEPQPYQHADVQTHSKSPSLVSIDNDDSFVIANHTPFPPGLSPPTTSGPNHARPDPPTIVSQPEQVQAHPQPQPQPSPQPQARSARVDSRPPDQGSSRTSLFLPHPNAPKPTTSSSGPMYARRTSPQEYPSPSAPPKCSAVNVIRTALTSQYGPNGMVRPTIYGQCDYDLLSALGPVPISFSLTPPKSVPALKATSAFPLQNVPRRAATTSVASDSATMSVNSSPHGAPASSNSVLRANFFPKARPRSRSFSELNKPSNETTLSSKRSLEEASKPLRISTSARASVSTAPKSPLSPISSRSSHAPSPLSLPQNNNVPVSRTVTKSLSYSITPSPLSQGARANPPSTNDAIPPSPTTARPEAAVTELAAPSPPPSHHPYPFPPLESINPKSDTPESPPSVLRARRSVDGNLSPYGDLRAQVHSPSPGPTLVRNMSLRSKMSLPNLRGKSSIKSSKDEPSDAVASPQTFGSGTDNETVQVKDMDFELIRPIISHIPEVTSTRTSGESTILPSFDGKSDLSPGLLRTDSPTVSLSSGAASGKRSPSTFSEDARPRTPKDLESSIDAHRQRELKWVYLMSAVPAAQSRKNKKIKKLLLEGVPSSVRYLVWAHLTNSKARGVAGVYAQLGKRGKVPAFSEIERDVQKCFADQPRLRAPDGPVFSLLQAYLTMVPDIRYHIALTYIAGHLLLLSPEEDAFWIFVSLMDSHLRPYFSSSIIQMEVDASLFSKALETTDAPLARKMFVDMGISPAAACRPWLSSLFAETLPLDYLHRVWDLFLYEGVPFLLRVGLAICSICRRHLFESTSEQSLLDHLLHPSSNSLPSVDAFLSLTFSVKLKDDEVRKQRIKMEAQVKRQTQTQTRAMSTSGVRVRAPSVSLPRS